MTIYDIADLMDVEIIITRFANQKDRWICQFKNCDTKDRSDEPILTGTYGTGNDPASAIVNYVLAIRSKILVFNAADPNKRRELKIPKNLES